MGTYDPHCTFLRSARGKVTKDSGNRVTTWSDLAHTRKRAQFCNGKGDQSGTDLLLNFLVF